MDTIQTTGVWQLRLEANGASLVRPATDDTILLEGVDPALALSVFTRLEVGCGTAEAMRQLESLGADAAEMLSLLQDNDVLRQSASEGKVEIVQGDGPLASALRETIGHHRFAIDEPLLVFEAAHWKELSRGWPHSQHIAITALGDALVASRGCPGCLVLRGLPVLQGRSSHARVLRLEPENASPRLHHSAFDRALLAELLLELEKTELRPEEGLWVSAGQLQRGWVLAHGDCAGAHPRIERGEATLRARLFEQRGTESAPERRRWAIEALLESPFSPACPHAVRGDSKELPLGVPFIWGDTRLVRELDGVVANVSIEGIIHGGGRTDDESQLIAMSEAVERLAAQSAT